MLRVPRIAALDLGLCAGLKAIASGLVLASGFTAISDDDYARVVIAERFAAAPSPDPSGTSWLPFPFYVYGAALRLFGSSLFVARGVALVAGVASVLLVLLAARVMGLERRAAFLAAALAGLLPYSLYLGAAMVPEALTAGLMVFAAAALTAGGTLRVLGALALFGATGARYEAWPLAALFAALSAWDARRSRERSLWASAGVALAFPLLWLLHGIVRHGDALFFVTRVSNYRAALGAAERGLGSRLLHAPLELVSAEPEVVVLALLALPFLLRNDDVGRARWLRFTMPLAGVLAFLIAGDARGAAPTHHGERALLALWFAAAVVVAAALEAALRGGWRERGFVALAVGATLGLGSVIRDAAPRDAFVDRSQAERIGERARQRTTRLAIDAPDFSFFAIQAAFGRPDHTLVLDDRDPRKPRSPDLLANEPRALAQRLSNEGLGWLALPRVRAPLATAIGNVGEGNSEWVLLELSKH